MKVKKMRNVTHERSKKMGKRVEINIKTAAKLMHKDPQYVRLGLQQQRLPFGSAVQKPDGRWSYNIIPIKFYEYIGSKEVNCYENY